MAHAYDARLRIFMRTGDSCMALRLKGSPYSLGNSNDNAYTLVLFSSFHINSPNPGSSAEVGRMFSAAASSCHGERLVFLVQV
jgi:hypothetical protein